MFNVYSEFFTKQFIGGRWVDSASAELTDVENPALMQPFAKIPALAVRPMPRPPLKLLRPHCPHGQAQPSRSALP